MMLSIVEVEMNSQPFCCSLQDTTYVFEILASIIDKKNTLIDHTSTNFVLFVEVGKIYSKDGGSLKEKIIYRVLKMRGMPYMGLRESMWDGWWR